MEVQKIAHTFALGVVHKEFLRYKDLVQRDMAGGEKRGKHMQYTGI